ncbi:hypothetical protein A2154_04275 [Candidatus Gottesmanbacteria bacterium RBG_16_43_7]|uniref:Uncharacterized protein n=1 Tax=Candidatus Gottesmanbacteria bacterium RBG_16_43_7 TaxID=1798373 RepID=A0A1F5Z8Y2_9BACT|nr:MAG: hypothetical protein A2154_04275 [Candidatus Gottesmanbacteria bacterium RBG_16_43_7]
MTALRILVAIIVKSISGKIIVRSFSSVCQFDMIKYSNTDMNKYFIYRIVIFFCLLLLISNFQKVNAEYTKQADVVDENFNVSITTQILIDIFGDAMRNILSVSWHDRDKVNIPNFGYYSFIQEKGYLRTALSEFQYDHENQPKLVRERTSDWVVSRTSVLCPENTPSNKTMYSQNAEDHKLLDWIMPAVNSFYNVKAPTYGNFEKDSETVAPDAALSRCGDSNSGAELKTQELDTFECNPYRIFSCRIDILNLIRRAALGIWIKYAQHNEIRGACNTGFCEEELLNRMPYDQASRSEYGRYGLANLADVGFEFETDEKHAVKDNTYRTPLDIGTIKSYFALLKKQFDDFNLFNCAITLSEHQPLYLPITKWNCKYPPKTKKVLAAPPRVTPTPDPIVSNDITGPPPPEATIMDFPPIDHQDIPDFCQEIGPDPNSTVPIEYLAVTVFAESRNGALPIDTQRLIANVIYNRAVTGEAVPFTAADTILYQSMYDDAPSSYPPPTGNQETNAELAYNQCLRDPHECPDQAARYQNTLNIMTQVCIDRHNGIPDPTNDSIFFSLQNDLTRTGVTFATPEELREWLEANSQYHQQEIDTGFQYLVAPVAPNQSWISGNHTQVNSWGGNVFYSGNDSCVTDALCGYGRPGR